MDVSCLLWGFYVLATSMVLIYGRVLTYGQYALMVTLLCCFTGVPCMTPALGYCVAGIAILWCRQWGTILQA